MVMLRRSREREYLDDHRPPPEALDEIYAFLGGINRWLGGTRATLSRFREFSRTWRVGERIEVLDVASGGGEVGRALVRWGATRGFDVRVTALDLNLGALRYARRYDHEVPLECCLRRVCADVHWMPFQRGAFDYVTCTSFVHHLTDAQVVRTLRSFDALAKRGVVVNDLIRGWRGYAWSWALTRPFNAILRHDGPLSVRRAFRPDELLALARRAELTWLSVRRHPGHRMTLAGERAHSIVRPAVPGPGTTERSARR